MGQLRDSIVRSLQVHDKKVFAWAGARHGQTAELRFEVAEAAKNY